MLRKYLPRVLLFLNSLLLLAVSNGCADPYSKLVPPQPGWKHETWHATEGYGNYFGRDVNFAVDLPQNWRLSYVEGTGLVWTDNKDESSPFSFHYWGDQSFREKTYEGVRQAQGITETDWTEAGQLLDLKLKKMSLQHCYGSTLVSTTKTVQKTNGGISFLRGTLKYKENPKEYIIPSRRNKKLDRCIMVSDEGIVLEFDSSPITEKIAASLSRL